MLKTSTMVLALLLAACSSLSDPRLSGTFVSDRDATVQYLRGTGEYTADQLDKLAPLLGKMTVRYHGTMTSIDLDGVVEEGPFRIKEVRPESTVIESQLFDDPQVYTLTFTKDGYWVEGGILQPPFKEKFVRISQQEAAGDGSATPEP